MNVVVSIDLDHIHCNSKHYENNTISFAYQDTLSRIYEYLSYSHIDEFNIFARIDRQINRAFGNYLHVFNMVPCKGQHAEIGWHPHFCRADGSPEFSPEEIMKEMWETYVSTHVVRECKVARMGGAFMDNRIMQTLDEMGFLIDSSAMPGCSRDDQYRKYDWATTGNSFYRPGTGDYRSSGTPSRRILEMPMTTMPVAAPYDKKIQRRYVNPAMKPHIFQPAFAKWHWHFPALIITFHPDQLIEGYEDDLYLYGMDNFVENMEFIKKTIGNPIFTKMSKLWTR